MNGPVFIQACITRIRDIYLVCVRRQHLQYKKYWVCQKSWKVWALCHRQTDLPVPGGRKFVRSRYLQWVCFCQRWASCKKQSWPPELEVIPAWSRELHQNFLSHSTTANLTIFYQLLTKTPLWSSLQAWFFCLFFFPEGNYGNPRKKLYYFIYVGLHPIKKEKVMLLLLHHFTAWDFLNRSFTFLMWLGSSCLWISIIQLLCK